MRESSSFRKAIDGDRATVHLLRIWGWGSDGKGEESAGLMLMVKDLSRVR